MQQNESNDCFGQSFIKMWKSLGGYLDLLNYLATNQNQLELLDPSKKFIIKRKNSLDYSRL